MKTKITAVNDYRVTVERDAIDYTTGIPNRVVTEYYTPSCVVGGYVWVTSIPVGSVRHVQPQQALRVNGNGATLTQRHSVLVDTIREELRRERDRREKLRWA